ncbi:MAG: lysophospholipase L1-like esterase [Myxococcota bacterium]
MSILTNVASLGIQLALLAPPTPSAVQIEFGESMTAFIDGAGRAQSGLQRQLRVVHFGDSNIAARAWSNAVARRLSALSRPGGPGYLLPEPGRTVRSGPVRVTAGPGWTRRQARFRGRETKVGDGMFGLMGASLDSAGPGALLDVRVKPGTSMTIDIVALCRPNGGTLVITGGGNTRRLDTGCEQVSVVRESFDMEGDRPRLKIHVRGRSVRVLGVSAERPEGGVVYDILGINGHQVSAIGHWNASVIGSQLRRRRPDLIVLSYGGNEAFNRELSLPGYRAMLQYAVARVRLLTPNASCLLTGPIATCPKGRVAAVTPRVRAIIGIQRLVARQSGCAFWDSAAVSGGADGLCPWTAARPRMVAPDGLHLSQRGYTAVGERLGDALMALVRNPKRGTHRINPLSIQQLYRPPHLQEIP